MADTLVREMPELATGHTQGKEGLMGFRLFQLCVMAVCCSVSLAAQQSPAAKPVSVPATREQVKHLFEVMDIHEQMRTTMDVMRAQMRKMMRDDLKKHSPEISEGQLSRIEATEAETSKSLDLDGMLDDLIPVYQKHLTETDIDAMIAFYATPTGQKLMHEQPQMAAESTQAVSGRMQKSMDDIMRRIEQAAKDENAKPKPSGQQPSPKPEQFRN